MFLFFIEFVHHHHHFFSSQLSKLSFWDLINCEVTQQDHYRQTMFNLLPQLKYLDNRDRSGGLVSSLLFSFISTNIIFILVEKDTDEDDESKRNS